MRDLGFRFDAPVTPDGYAWWYVDAISDDGQHGLTIIAFIGSVFSPYYAAARRRGPADPADFCAINVALYGPRGKYWAMTERRRSSLRRSISEFAVGKSGLRYNGQSLIIGIDELSIPRFGRIRGQVTLHPQIQSNTAIALDDKERHIWRPIAPRARVDVKMHQPAIAWSGSGYLDSNSGTAPLEDDFRTWTWSRADSEEGSTILYDVVRKDGTSRSVALAIGKDGVASSFEPPPVVTLPRTKWRIARDTRSERAEDTNIRRTLEDTPFYARSIVSSRLRGRNIVSMHESLSLDRFSTRLVQAMLPFRMPRALS